MTEENRVTGPYAGAPLRGVAAAQLPSQSKANATAATLEATTASASGMAAEAAGGAGAANRLPVPASGQRARLGRPPRRVHVQRLHRAVDCRPGAMDFPGGQPADSGQAPATPARQDSVTGVEKGGGEERGDWVKQLLEGLWPYARDATQRMAWELIPEQLEASRPSFVYSLEMEQFSLGEAHPVVRDVRVHAPAGGAADELFLEFEAEWASEQDISLLITVPRLPVAVAELTPDPLEDALRLVLRLRVALRAAWVRAGVRVTLRPLLRRLPVVGAVQVGLSRLPEFGYELDLSLASEALVPLLRSWLDEAVRDLVLQPWVLPEHYFFPLDPEVRDVQTPAGVLAVRVLGADQVPKPGLFGTAHPMLELFLRASQRRQTHVAPAGRSASWGDAQFEFPVSVPEHEELKVVLYDWNEWTPNEELGRASLALRELQPGRTQEVELHLRAAAEQKREEEEQKDLSALQRASLVMGLPITKKSGAVCSIRLQVTYVALSEEQSRLIMEQQLLPVPRRSALPAAAAAEAAGAGGLGSGIDGRAAGSRASGPSGSGLPQEAQEPARVLPPLALRLLCSGLLIVGVPRAEGLLEGRGLSMFKPYYKTVVRVGDRQAESDAARASRQGVVQFSLPVALHLPAEVLQDASAEAQLELLEHGWVGGPTSRGQLSLSLQELAGGARVQGRRRLGAGRVELELDSRFQPYF